MIEGVFMNSKIPNILILLAFLIIGVLSFNATKTFSNPMGNNTIGSDYYPKVLTILLISFSIVGILKEFIKKREVLKVNKIKPILISLLLIIIYFLSWYYVGYFYIITFLFLVISINYYDFLVVKKINTKMVLINGGISLGAIIVINLLFDKILAIVF